MCKPHWLTYQQPNIEFDMLKTCLTLVSSHTSMNMSVRCPCVFIALWENKAEKQGLQWELQVRICSEATGSCMSEWDTHTHSETKMISDASDIIAWVLFSSSVGLFYSNMINYPHHTHMHTQWCSHRVSSRSQVSLCTQTSWKKGFVFNPNGSFDEVFLFSCTRTTSEVWELLPRLQ